MFYTVLVFGQNKEVKKEIFIKKSLSLGIIVFVSFFFVRKKIYYLFPILY